MPLVPKAPMRVISFGTETNCSRSAQPCSAECLRARKNNFLFVNEAAAKADLIFVSGLGMLRA
jgi:hypothetical protein